VDFVYQKMRMRSFEQWELVSVVCMICVLWLCIS